MPEAAKTDEKFVDADVVSAVREGGLERLLDDAFRDLDQDRWTDLVQRALALQRSNQIDLIASLTANADTTLPYVAEKFLAEILPALDLPLDALLSLLPHLVKRSRTGGVPFYFLEHLGGWCDADVGRCDAVLAAVRQGSASRELLFVTLASGLRQDEQRYSEILAAMLTAQSEEEARAAASALGYASPANLEVERAIDAALGSALGQVAGDGLPAIFAALLRRARTTGNDQLALDAVTTAGRLNSPAIRAAAATALFMNDAAPRSEPVVSALCGLLQAIEAGESATIELLDHALHDLIEGAAGAAARRLLEHLVSTEVVRPDKLESTMQKIRTTPGLFEGIVADWLADGSIGLVDAIADIVTVALNDPPEFDLDFSGRGLSPDEAAAIGRRAIYSLMLYPVSAASVLVSLLRTGPAAAAPVIGDMLFDPLLISYWNDPKAYLERIVPGEAPQVAAVITNALARLADHIGAIEAGGDIAELRPSEKRRFIAAVKRSEEQRAILKGAREGSLASLFPTSILLYGDSAVGEVMDGAGSAMRTEFRMGSVEHSSEIPRLEVIDPVGFWYQRFAFSMGKAPR